MKKLAVLLVLACVLSPATLFGQSVEEKAQICSACHGENGVPADQQFPVPIIWGQNIGYLFFQLRDFKSGARKNEQMSTVAEALDPADFMPFAQYFSKKAWPNLEQPRPPTNMAAVAQRVNTSVVCTSCHLEGFKGDSTQPRLAGQTRAYLQKTMIDFSTGARANNPGMTGFMKGLTDDEISAMAAWLSGM